MTTVTLKTVQGKTFPLNLQLTDTISDVKLKVEENRGQATFPACSQVIIYDGKVLQDDMTLGDYGLTETGFLVVMVKLNKKPIKVRTTVTSRSAELREPPSSVCGELWNASFSEASTNPAEFQFGTLGPNIEDVVNARLEDQLAVQNLPDLVDNESDHDSADVANSEADQQSSHTNREGTSVNDTQRNTVPFNMFAPRPRLGRSGFSRALRNDPRVRALANLTRKFPHMLESTLDQLQQSETEASNRVLLSLIRSHPVEFFQLVHSDPEEGEEPDDNGNPAESLNSPRERTQG